MIKLRLANEYLVGPIFCPEPDAMGHIDVDDLPLSQELKAEITAWDSEYQATLNSDYPPDSGFGSPEMELRHIARGKQLAKKLQKELGGAYTVEYCP
ncbi:hypothetical protein NNO07_00015 [Pseudomonas resinovorans]|uniref:Uncharacterized protein n=1 Tax=Metapseudomonas resinovorans TaxID=53412 RepID=A0ABT4XY64_METRE|nr:hypothetical protein [Pseudomonas resinovorans]MDA8481434.1 hypothetical protein [Pseudomonas resinovorans]